jgi:oligopeptide transport system substrate-binding protein
MKFGKLLLTSAALALTAVSLSACGQNSAKKTQTLNWMTTAEVPTMDPSKAYDSNSGLQLSTTNEGLYEIGKDGQAKLALAKSVKTNADKTKWIFTLRKAKWSNGDPVTAKDFVYGWRRTVNPKTEAQNAYLYDGVVKNATEISAKKKPVSSLGIKALGKYKLEVDLAAHTPYFAQLVAGDIFLPQNEKVVKKYASKYGTASKYMVFNGPFIQKGWSSATLSWKLVKNPNYWDKKHVKLNQINFSVQKSPSTSYNLYQQGKLDTTYLDYSQTKQLKNKSDFVVRPAAQTNYIEFNQSKSKTFQNENIRKAIDLAINRKALCQTLGGINKPAASLTPTNCVKDGNKDYTDLLSSSAKKMSTYQPALAKKYFKKGLQELGKKKLSINLMYDDTDAAKRVTETLQSQLETALPGLTVKVQNVPYKTRLTRAINQQFQVVVTSWGADIADPIDFLQLVQSKNDNNDGKYNNAEFDSYLEKGNQTENDHQRLVDFAHAEDTLLNTAGIAPLYYASSAWLVKSHVKGLVYTKLGGYNFKSVYIK